MQDSKYYINNHTNCLVNFLIIRVFSNASIFFILFVIIVVPDLMQIQTGHKPRVRIQYVGV